MSRWVVVERGKVEWGTVDLLFGVPVETLSGNLEGSGEGSGVVGGIDPQFWFGNSDVVSEYFFHSDNIIGEQDFNQSHLGWDNGMDVSKFGFGQVINVNVSSLALSNVDEQISGSDKHSLELIEVFKNSLISVSDYILLRVSSNQIGLDIWVFGSNGKLVELS